MSEKYIIVHKGFGKFKHSPKVKRISERKAEMIERKGEKVYNSKEEAEENLG